MKNTMIYDDNSTFIPVFPLIKDKVNLTHGTHKVDNMIHCVEYGVIRLKWDDGSTTDIEMVENIEYGFTGEIEVKSGKFHIC